MTDNWKLIGCVATCVHAGQTLKQMTSIRIYVSASTGWKIALINFSNFQSCTCSDNVLNKCHLISAQQLVLVITKSRQNSTYTIREERKKRKANKKETFATVHWIFTCWTDDSKHDSKCYYVPKRCQRMSLEQQSMKSHYFLFLKSEN